MSMVVPGMAVCGENEVIRGCGKKVNPDKDAEPPAEVTFTFPELLLPTTARASVGEKT